MMDLARSVKRYGKTGKVRDSVMMKSDLGADVLGWNHIYYSRIHWNNVSNDKGNGSTILCS